MVCRHKETYKTINIQICFLTIPLLTEGNNSLDIYSIGVSQPVAYQRFLKGGRHTITIKCA